MCQIEVEPGQLPLTILAMPLKAHMVPINRSGDPDRAVAAVIISNPEHTVASLPLIARHYKLTPAETALVSELVSGRSLKQYANDHGVSYETVRTQIRAVFLKTGAGSQSDLILKIMNSPLSLFQVPEL